MFQKIFNQKYFFSFFLIFFLCISCKKENKDLNKNELETNKLDSGLTIKKIVPKSIRRRIEQTFRPKQYSKKQNLKKERKKAEEERKRSEEAKKKAEVERKKSEELKNFTNKTLKTLNEINEKTKFEIKRIDSSNHDIKIILGTDQLALEIKNELKKWLSMYTITNITKKRFNIIEYIFSTRHIKVKEDVKIKNKSLFIAEDLEKIRDLVYDIIINFRKLANKELNDLIKKSEKMYNKCFNYGKKMYEEISKDENYANLEYAVKLLLSNLELIKILKPSFEQNKFLRDIRFDLNSQKIKVEKQTYFINTEDNDINNLLSNSRKLFVLLMKNLYKFNILKSDLFIKISKFFVSNAATIDLKEKFKNKFKKEELEKLMQTYEIITKLYEPFDENNLESDSEALDVHEIISYSKDQAEKLSNILKKFYK